jgi:hypothetical protein
MSDETDIEITTRDGTTETVTLPTDLIDMFNEAGDPPAAVVGDIVQIAFTQRVHMIVSHGDGAVDEETEAVERHARDLFEDRFGQTFAEMTGHDH